MQWSSERKINLLNKVWIGKEQTQELDVEDFLWYGKRTRVHKIKENYLKICGNWNPEKELCKSNCSIGRWNLKTESQQCIQKYIILRTTSIKQKLEK